MHDVLTMLRSQPPSGGCVLKLSDVNPDTSGRQPAAFGRLCVETEQLLQAALGLNASRLRAAVC